MMVATAAQMKELDRQAIEEYGIPSLDLMEHAAQAVANEVRELLKGYKNPLIGGAVSAIIMGSSDTVSEEKRAEKEQEHQRLQAILDEKKRDAARILMGMGCRVRAFLVGDRSKMTPDERAMEEKLQEAGGVLEDYRPRDQEQSFWLSQCDCLVDALFGVGLSRPIEGDFLFAVHLMQDRPDLRRVVSCDMPSGIHADTGEVLGEAVRAGVNLDTIWGTGRSIRENFGSMTSGFQTSCNTVERTASMWRPWMRE